jgi:(S)-ureidoglycine aminohydrolase
VIASVTDHRLTISTSRGRRRATYHLLTPPNRYASRLAELRDTTVFKLATPRTQTARFGQYLVRIAPGGGGTGPVGAGFEHFVIGLIGEATLDGEPLRAGAFAYVPEGTGITLAGVGAPAALRGHRDDHEPVVTDVGLLRRELLPPDDPAFDFNMSLLAFPPGVSLGQVEVHDEEHGLYMTAGGGVYHLDGSDHEVVAGDFIYMAPYCPQSFTPTGTETAEYLLYKDVFRDGF